MVAAFGFEREALRKALKLQLGRLEQEIAEVTEVETKESGKSSRFNHRDCRAGGTNSKLGRAWLIWGWWQKNGRGW